MSAAARRYSAEGALTTVDENGAPQTLSADESIGQIEDALMALSERNPLFANANVETCMVDFRLNDRGEIGLAEFGEETGGIHLGSGVPMSFPEVSDYLAAELESDLVRSDGELPLWLMDAKGAVWSSRSTSVPQPGLRSPRPGSGAWSQSTGAESVRRAGDHRVHGRLELLTDALRASIELKDGGAHIRYPKLMGPEDAIRYFDRTLQLVRSPPELDTSTMAIAGKARALLRLENGPTRKSCSRTRLIWQSEEPSRVVRLGVA